MIPKNYEVTIYLGDCTSAIQTRGEPPLDPPNPLWTERKTYRVTSDLPENAIQAAITQAIAIYKSEWQTYKLAIDRALA